MPPQGGALRRHSIFPMNKMHVFVIGAGTMGNGIAQTAATSRFAVTIMDVNPLALIGLDVVRSILEVLQRDLGEDKYRPAYQLRKMMDAGHLGRKSGKGFFNYP